MADQDDTSKVMGATNYNHDRPLLTILVPTYNRVARAKALVSNLLPLVNGRGGEIEIVLSDNKSEDDTQVEMSRFSSPFLRIVTQPIHLGTVEEHIFACVELCRGRYVWFLGDDDIPQHETILFTMGLLRDGAHDFLTFNSITVDPYGAPSGAWVASSDLDLVTVDFTAGATMLGYTFGIAGISNAIMLVEPLKQTDWRQVFAIQSIYSHVAWWLIAFKGRTLTAVNKILVYYLIDTEDIVYRFDRYAAKNEIADYHFWSCGLVKQLTYVEEQGGISIDNINRMFEQRYDGTYYRFLDNILHMTWAQINLTVTDIGHTRNRIGKDDLDVVTDWILRADPSYFEALSIIADIHDMRPLPHHDAGCRTYVPSRFARDLAATGSARLQELNRLFKKTQKAKETTAHWIGMVGQYRGYSIYRHIDGYVAFDDDSVCDRQTVLRKFAVVPTDESLVAAPTEEKMREAIAGLRSRQLESLSYSKREKASAASAERKVDPAPLPSFGSGFARSASGITAYAIVRGATRLYALLAARYRRRHQPGYFDRDFYLDRNVDVRDAGVDPFRHFVRHGAAEGRSPNALFDPAWYIRTYMEPHDHYAAALEDYLLKGMAEGRQPNPFDTAEDFAAKYKASPGRRARKP